MDSVRPIHFNLAVANLAETPGSMDDNPAFQQIAEGAWAAIREFIQSPSDTTAKLAMYGVNTLSNYFTANGIPSQADNPLAYAIYEDLQSGIPGWQYTISQACGFLNSDAGDTFSHNLALSQEDGNSPFGSIANPYTGDPGFGLEKDINALGSGTADSSNKFIFMDLYLLQYDLHQNDGSDAAAQNIAALIKDLNNHIAASDAKDGYLTSLLAFFHLPITTTSGTSDLIQLASEYDPSNAASVTAFKAALASLYEAGGKGGQLYQTAYVAYLEEEYGRAPPFPVVL